MSADKMVSIEPFSLLGPENRETKLAELHNYLPRSTCIQDAYPCTPLQEGLLALSMKQDGLFMLQAIYKLPKKIDIPRFQSAWQAVVDSNSTLRTRFVQTRWGVIQVVLAQSSIIWLEDTDTQRYLRDDSRIPAALGDNSLRFAIIHEPHSDQKTFVWTFHHAIIDGWAWRLLLEQVDQYYKSNFLVPLVEFNHFIDYTRQLGTVENHRQFWLEYLADSKSLVFPTRATDDYLPCADSFEELEINIPNSLRSIATASTIIQAAYSVLIASQTKRSEATYGLVLAGRNLDMPGLTRVNGPTFTTIPFRVTTNPEISVATFLEQIYQTRKDIKTHQHIGLQNIRTFGPETAKSCNFQNLLVIQPQVPQNTGSLFSKAKHASDFLTRQNAYVLTTECNLTDEGFVAGVSFDSNVICWNDVRALLKQFQSLINSFSAEPGRLLKSVLPLVNDCNTGDSFGDTKAESVQACVHDYIWDNTQHQPFHAAVDAWDGAFTYSQLDLLSDRLAHRLQQSGVGPEVKVPLIFEKSKWAVVAILSVIKAGGCFVSLDPSQPNFRIESLIKQVGGRILLCSEKLIDNYSGMASEALAVSMSLMENLAAVEGGPYETGVQPNNAVYIIFTSGTSGKPKGCVIEHTSCCSQMRHLRNLLNMDPTTRTFQTSSYTFDACILEILVTLGAGGTICIPSEEEKMNNVVAAINRTKSNLAWFTPSFARLISPDSVPTLKTLGMGGEKLVKDDINLWSTKVRLFNMYGPTEGCITCIATEVKDCETSPSKIGNAYIGSYMVLDDDLKICKSGAVGELYIGGPHIARGYLNDPQKTAEAFLSTPDSAKHPDLKCRRWYKTGDLVKQEAATSALEIIGRRDGQVKLRGQRIEMGEVEFHLRQTIDNVVDLAATVATPADGPAFLAAFVCLRDASADTVPCSETLPSGSSGVLFSSTAFAKLVDALHMRLPHHMVPTLFVPITSLPLNIAGKIDRRILEANAADFTKDQRILYSGGEREYIRPSTQVEIELQHLWARVLKVEASLIGRYDKFVRLGGDSILAMKLVSLARAEGLSFSVRDLFEYPSLSALAKTVKRTDVGMSTPACQIPPFSLISGAEVSSIVNNFSYLGISKDKIVDCYPCTPFQEGVMALSLAYLGSYVCQHVFELSETLSHSLPAFRAAWEYVFASNPILRTRIVETDTHGLLQLVVHERVEWIVERDLQIYIVRDRSKPMGLGSPLARLAIVGPNSAGVYHFVWTKHHAIYDAWSMGLVLKDFDNAYRRLADEVPNQRHAAKQELRILFNHFVADLQNVELRNAKEFWLAELGSGSPVQFPSLPKGYFPVPNESAVLKISYQRQNSSGFRTSTFIRAAWAITMSTYASSNDILFGAILFGRTGPAENLSAIVGPTLATVPVRILLDQKMSVKELLQKVETKMVKMMPFEQTGLSIIRKMDARLNQACDFQNLLVIQPKDNSSIDETVLGRRLNEYDESQAFDTYALTMECTLDNDGLCAKAIFDPKVIEATQMTRILSHFKHVLDQLFHEDSKTIRELNTISFSDNQEIWRWNAVLPETSNSCVHSLIEAMASENENAQAICSWDGDLSRGQLDKLSTKLAQELIRQGVCQETKIPLLFDKSKWAVVATLAVIKAGAAFVPLDPLHPISRHAGIAEQINASIILCSPQHESRCHSSLPQVKAIVVDASQLASLPIPTSPIVANIGPNNALYVVYTSGSTGTPKGAVIEHGAYCSGAKEHAKALGFSETSRFLQFASYSFDTSIEDILTTLMTGGCLCIPSEEERISDLTSAIVRMNVNSADLTSSYISSISPDAVPSLTRLTLGGEPLTASVVKVWADRVQLINAYGVTECCVTSLVNADIAKSTDPANIGRPVGAVSWIVDAEDTNRLVPIGVIGELLIEGPAQARGYLNDEVRTNAVFIHDPLWALDSRQVRGLGRLYKTGDLVRYNADGTINYIGRKDTQVKLRGQRIELSGIESHLLESPNVRNAMVLLPSKGPYKDKITALIELGITIAPAGNNYIQVVSASVLVAAKWSWSQISDRLRQVVPSYMVPTAWIAIQSLPLSTSAKLDRSKLSTWLSQLPQDHCTTQTFSSSVIQQIPIDDEIAHSISQKVAELSTSSNEAKKSELIGLDVNLTTIGIDSIKMMSLSAFLKRTYSVAVPMKLLMDYRTTITVISAHIYSILASKKKSLSTSPTFHVNLLSEMKELDSQLQIYRNQYLGSVFLTGSTGFLGNQILRQLLVYDGVTNINVLVRAEDHESGLKKLINAAEIAKWWSPGFLNSRLTIWLGDLALPHLGLDPKHWKSLNHDVDTIIHNGASVHWTSDYHTLRPSNVNSTVELLKTVSTSKRPMKFVYVTGGRYFLPSESDVEIARKLSTLDGYSQTKFLSEMLIRSFATRNSESASRIAIVKPGLIIGTQDEGIANKGDFLWRYVAAAVGIGAFPSSDKEEGWLVVSSVDRVAESVVHALTKPEAIGGKNIDIQHGINMSDFWSIVNSHLEEEKKMKEIEAGEWFDTVQREIERRGEGHPLWPVQGFLAREGNLGVDGYPEGGDRELLRVAVERNVRVLMEGGFFG